MPPVDEAKLKKVIVNKLMRDDDSSVQQDTLQAIVDLMQGRYVSWLLTFAS